MKFSPLLVTVALLAQAMGGHVAWAEKADRDKPMQVEADRMQHDEGRKLTQLTGNVHATKGSLVMRAARMDVQQDDKGQQLLGRTGSARVFQAKARRTGRIC